MRRTRGREERDSLTTHRVRSAQHAWRQHAVHLRACCMCKAVAPVSELRLRLCARSRRLDVPPKGNSVTAAVPPVTLSTCAQCPPNTTSY